MPKADDDDGTVYPKNREGEAAFKRVLKELDVQIGRLIEGLKQLNIEDNTIVVFTSDNGPMPSFKGSRSGGLRGSKLSLYEGGIRMPFIISWPGHIPAGRTDMNSVVTALDLLPSLSKICGVNLPAGYKADGVDRAAVLRGKPSARPADIFWEYGRNNIAYSYPKALDKSPALAIRSGRWKLLMNEDGSDRELYDMLADPLEKMNIVSNNEKIAAQLQVKLQNWWSHLPKLKE
ncbi:sulfatase family protein [Niabella hibiscisoli]|uniref:sulfatase family protein n=1 Tax=Niabella hibiscisoli TaxID=1825928 RepID=UPI00293E1665|nr:sulfatase-like hydrolase/transferase [Niabella hibiscisoli]